MSTSAPYSLCHQLRQNSWPLCKLQELRIPLPTYSPSHPCSPFPNTLGSCWHPTPLISEDRQQEVCIPDARETYSGCWTVEEPLQNVQGPQQTFKRQTHQAKSSRPNCSGKISDLSKGNVLFCMVTLICQAPHKSRLPVPPHHSQTHLRATCLDLFHTLCYSIHGSSQLLTWGLTHFPVYSLASTLIPNVLHSFFGNDLCFPFD